MERPERVGSGNENPRSSQIVFESLTGRLFHNGWNDLLINDFFPRRFGTVFPSL